VSVTGGLNIICFQFEKPGRRDDFDYPEMAKEAVTKALNDAGVQIADIKQACVGYVYGMYSVVSLLSSPTCTSQLER
jgi:3-oxoacyl-[acyl-carrier-protein] synthase III